MAAKYAFLIPSKNRFDKLCKVIATINGDPWVQKQWKPRIIVLDDASDTPYNEGRLPKSSSGRIILLRNKHSEGIASARQRITDYALGLGANRLFMLDDDISGFKGAFQPIIEARKFLRKHKVAYGLVFAASCHRRELAKFRRCKHLNVFPFMGTQSWITYMDANFVRKVRYDPTFKDCDDTYLCLKAQDLGYINFLVYESNCTHVMGQEGGAFKDARKRSLQQNAYFLRLGAMFPRIISKVHTGTRIKDGIEIATRIMRKNKKHVESVHRRLSKLFPNYKKRYSIGE